MREKIVWILGGLSLASLLEYLWISGEALTIFTVVLTLDFIFGVIDAYLKDRTSVKSETAIRGLIKKLSKLITPMIVVIILKGAGFENIQPLINSVMGILIVAEGYSIIGHIYCINTGKSLPEIDWFEFAIQKIIELFRPKITDSKSNNGKEQ